MTSIRDLSKIAALATGDQVLLASPTSSTGPQLTPATQVETLVSTLTPTSGDVDTPWRPEEDQLADLTRTLTLDLTTTFVIYDPDAALAVTKVIEAVLPTDYFMVYNGGNREPRLAVATLFGVT